MVDAPESEKRMRLRYAGVCRICGAQLAPRTEAVYERTTKTVRCLDHTALANKNEVVVEPEEVVRVDPGTPGASARREYERRRAKRAERVRARSPKLAPLILALSEERQTTTAWQTGARGEEALGAGLNALSRGGVHVLHDRRIPGSRANIDHLAVTSTGVYVIDAKYYRGPPRLVATGGLLTPRVTKLMVGGRDCTKLVDGVLKQVEVVRAILEEGVPVQGVLCFVGADWPLIGGGFATRGVAAMRPKKLFAMLVQDGPVEPKTATRLHSELATRLPPA